MTLKDALEQLSNTSEYFNYKEMETVTGRDVIMDAVITRKDGSVFSRHAMMVSTEEDREAFRRECLRSVVNTAMLSKNEAE